MAADSAKATAMPSVVTWWQVAAVAPVASVAAAPASVPAVAPPTGGQKAVRKRSREVDAVVTGPEAQPRAKRERSQTQLYDPVVEATRHSPVNPEAGVLDPAAEQKQDSRRRRASAGAPGMLATDQPRRAARAAARVNMSLPTRAPIRGSLNAAPVAMRGRAGILSARRRPKPWAHKRP